ncbi:MAG: glutamate--cysteine ligase [Brachymonas sp.]|nr:glutamate--cysteine ligase [Brachymonas sp.]
MVPHLSTALHGPINELEQRIIDSMPATERWFRLEWMEHTPAFYCAADIHNAGFKLAAVETNLYPSGWCHLSEATLPLAVQAAQAAIERICPEARNLLLIPENQMHDATYLNNVAQLVRIFRMAGLNVRLGSISNDIKEPTRVDWPQAQALGEPLLLEPVIRSERRVGLKNFDPCTVLINNDLQAGAPGILEELYEQYILPPVHAGWRVRRRSRHLACYEEVGKRFGRMLGIDPWLIAPLFSPCGELDLAQAADKETLRGHVDALLSRLRRKYKEYGIPEKPFVSIKADQGAAAGMKGITVYSVDELDRHLPHLGGHLPASQDSQPENAGRVDLVLQEGVPSHERIEQAAAKPVVYMLDRYVVGGFYRLHGPSGDAKAGAAQHVPLSFDEKNQLPDPGVKPGASVPNRFYMYGVVARLAMLAASYELEATDPEAAQPF